MYSSVLHDQPRALITGSASRIGAAVSEALREAGARGTHLNDHGLGNTETATTTELDGAAVGSVVERIADELGGLDLLVINTPPSSSSLSTTDWESFTDEEFDRPFLQGPRLNYLLIAAAMPYLAKSENGRIVVTGSTEAWNGSTDGPQHGAASSALLGLVRALARELGPDGIRINLIAYDPDGNDAALDSTAGRCLARPTRPADIASAVCLLASPLAGFITGQSVLVNGGSTFL